MDPICDLQERAWAARAARRFVAAEALLREALRVLEERGEGEHPDAANFARELADLFVALRRDGEAEELARRALRVVEATLAQAHEAGADAEVVAPLEEIRIESWKVLATALRGQGRYAEAEPVARRAAAASARLFGRRSIATASKLNDLGVVYKYAGRYESAARVYGRARRILEASADSDEELSGTVLYNLGGLAHAERDHARGEPLVREALGRLERGLGAEHPDVGAGYATLGALLQGMERLDEAEVAYARALAIVRAAYGERHPDVALVQANRAEIARARGDLARAEELGRAALALRQELFDDGHPSVATSLNNLALVLAAQGRRTEAHALVARAHAACVARCGSEHPTARLFARNLADLALDAGARRA